MKHFIKTLVVIVVSSHSWIANAAPKWTKLFDGKSLDGWEQRGGNAKYSVADGCIVGQTVLDTGNSFLCTKKDYGDFILELEFKVDPRLNSGVQIRSEYFDHETEPKDAKGNPVLNHEGHPIKVAARRVHGYQVEIDPSARAFSGGLYDEARRGWLQDLKDNEPARKAFRQGKWNTYRIEARGDSIKTRINGVAATDLHDDLTLKGFIALQVHGVGSDQSKENIEVRWRNIRLQELSTASSGRTARAASKPNVLLIIADDLNDWVGPMKGHPQVKTPNLDKLAARGTTFMNAQTAAPICNPSRASFMTGRRPATTGIYDNDQPAMPHIPRGVALNDYLRPFGYTSLGAGKIYHYRQYRAEDWDKVVFAQDDTLPNHEANRRPGPFGYRMFTEEKPDEPFNEQRAESKLVDAQTVSWCIDQLKERAEQTNAFFMACGIHRPHTPWDVPKKYFDMHPLESIQLPQVWTNDLGDVPAAGVRFARPQGPHAAVLKAGVWKDRVRAYLAAISYADAQIGRLLDALENSAQRDNTIIIFVSDHGWHLGEKEHWAKSALWRQATRVPFIWVVPGLTQAGTKCDRAVDLLSIFPTVCELTGVPTPKHAEGLSIKPLLANPAAPWKQPAITTHLQGNHAITTEDWRYIRYADGTEELYNEKTDPNEWTNQASKPELSKIKKDLARFLPSVNAKPVAHRETPRPRGRNGKQKVAPDGE